MRTTRILNTFLLVIVVLLIAAHTTQAQVAPPIEMSVDAGSGLDFDCNTGWNIPVNDWLWYCWIITDTTTESLRLTWDQLEYAGNINSWDEDMLYTVDDWRIVYGALLQIERDYWHSFYETCHSGSVPVKLYCTLIIGGSMVDWVVSADESMFSSFVEHFDGYTYTWGIADTTAHHWQNMIVCAVHPEYNRCSI